MPSQNFNWKLQAVHIERANEAFTIWYCKLVAFPKAERI
jgi:hypothetical protein